MYGLVSNSQPRLELHANLPTLTQGLKYQTI